MSLVHKDQNECVQFVTIAQHAGRAGKCNGNVIVLCAQIMVEPEPPPPEASELDIRNLIDYDIIHR